jgi:(S)-sulfolactate dehydrogenase
MTDIVISEFMDEAAVEDLRRDFSVTYDKGLVDRPDELARLVASARALVVRNRTQVRGALLAAGAKLEAVGRLGVGLDNIDLDACKARSIAVLPATGANDIAVAEWAVTTIMMLLRGAYFATEAVAAGGWPRERLMGREVHGKVLGLVGFGAIARETAMRARAMGMTIVASDPFVTQDDPAWAQCSARPLGLDALLREADAVSLHVPLTAETRNLIDAPRLAAMKPGAVVVNAARGGVIDEAALAAALRGGTIAGAALDVFEVEPLKAGSPLAACPNLILTPHIAGVTAESNVRVSSVTAANVRRVLQANTGKEHQS